VQHNELNVLKAVNTEMHYKLQQYNAMNLQLLYMKISPVQITTSYISIVKQQLIFNKVAQFHVNPTSFVYLIAVEHVYQTQTSSTLAQRCLVSWQIVLFASTRLFYFFVTTNGRKSDKKITFLSVCDQRKPIQC